VLRPERGEVLRPPATSWMPAASAALYARLDVAGHLELQARLALLQHRDAAIDAAVERFGLGPLLPRRADRLSTGQRQRLRLALAFLGDPQLVLLDEPRASLDEDGAAVLAGAVARATAIGATVVWAAPDPAGVPEDARRLRVHQGTVS
jgi:ABC-type multidrug transport system ATPase subunit